MIFMFPILYFFVHHNIANHPDVGQVYPPGHTKEQS